MPTILEQLVASDSVSLPSREEDNRYYAAVGRFIIAYAGAEAAVHLVARKLLQIRDDRARVVFGGMRIGDVVSRVRALLKLSKRSEKIKAEVEECLVQFDLIGTARDKIVHRLVDFAGGKIRVSNIFTAKALVHYEQEELGLDDLFNLEFDCLAIYMRLSRVRTPKKQSPIDQVVYEMSWRYRPASPKAHKKQNPPKTKAHKPQPQS